MNTEILLSRLAGLWGVALALLLMTGCAGIFVTTDYDTSRDFSRLKTYAWLEPKSRLVIDPLVDNDLMVKRIRRSVEAELAKRGYARAEGGAAVDFYITYHVSSEDRISISSFHNTFGYYPCWAPGCIGAGFNYSPDIHVSQYKQGTFMLDIVDPASDKLMWRGVAGQRLTSGTPEQRDEYVRGIISAILEKFPPGRNQQGDN